MKSFSLNLKCFRVTRVHLFDAVVRAQHLDRTLCVDASPGVLVLRRRKSAVSNQVGDMPRSEGGRETDRQTERGETECRYILVILRQDGLLRKQAYVHRMDAHIGYNMY